MTPRANPGEVAARSLYDATVRAFSTTFFVLVVAFVIGTQAACTDPCRQLADRICNCELTAAQRQTCRQDRIDTQSNDPLRLGPTTTSEQQDACIAALETCTCAALDENKTELCGYTNDPPAASDGEGE